MTDSGPKNAFTFNDGWKFGVKFMSKSKPSIFADVALEGYAPDHVIRQESRRAEDGGELAVDPVETERELQVPPE